jgi:PEP-CTERM motif
MRKCVLQSMCVVIGIGLLGTTQALADPVTVTSGHVTAQMSGGTFTLTGDGFSLTGAPPGGYESGIWECTPCRASDRLNLSLSSSAGGSFDDGLPGEFNHVPYDATWLAGHLAFTAPDMTSAILHAGQTSISMPFTFSGELANYESFRSRATAGSLPVFIATFTGSGIATAFFRGPVADPDGALFFADRITYDFAPAPPSPTPEPGSLLLLCTGAAGLLVRRRVRRRQSSRSAGSTGSLE